LSESGNFSRVATYKCPIGPLIYPQSDQNPALFERSDEKRRSVLTEFLINILTF
jgi:hypothetical protein